MTDHCRTCGRDLPEDRIVKPVVTIRYDHNCSNPIEYDFGIRLVPFNPKHYNFVHPDELDMGDMKRNWMAFPLSYYEHGNCSWTRTGNEGVGFEDQWDGRRNAGWLLLKKSEWGPATMEEFAARADNILKEYTMWCNGECYGFTIEDPITGEDIASSWGYIGLDDVRAALQEALEDAGFPTLAENEVDSLCP
jgi:hypothetical protein